MLSVDKLQRLEESLKLLNNHVQKKQFNPPVLPQLVYQDNRKIKNKGDFWRLFRILEDKNLYHL